MPNYIETIEEDLNRIWGDDWTIGRSGAGPNAYWFWYAGAQRTLQNPKGRWRCSGRADTMQEALLDMVNIGKKLPDSRELVDHPDYARVKNLEGLSHKEMGG
jgi:hypothetical protein